MAARWTLIWCVLPVSSRTRSMVCPAASVSTSKCVTAGFPTPAAMRVGLSGSRPTGSRSSPCEAALSYCYRPVDPVHAPGRHHLHEPGVCWLALRQNHQARGVAVEPVNHAWPGGIFPTFYFPVQECVHERTRRVAGTRMHHEARGLVDDQDVLVLEDYGNGYLFGREAFLRNLSLDTLSAAHSVGRRELLSIYEQEMLFDQSFCATTAHAETPRGQRVESLSGLCGVYIEGSGGHPAKAGTRLEPRPYSRRRRKRLALKIRLSERSPCSLSKNSCELLSWASDGSSCSTSSAASSSDTGGSDWTASELSGSSCAMEGSTSGSATSGSSAGDSAVSGSAARGPLPSVRITSVGCSSAARTSSGTADSSSAGSTTSSPESVSSISWGTGSSSSSATMPVSAAAIASAVTISSSVALASSWAASRTTAMDSVSSRSRRDASISLAEATSMLSIISV